MGVQYLLKCKLQSEVSSLLKAGADAEDKPSQVRLRLFYNIYICFKILFMVG